MYAAIPVLATDRYINDSHSKKTNEIPVYPVSDSIVSCKQMVFIIKILHAMNFVIPQPPRVNSNLGVNAVGSKMLGLL